MNIRKLIVNILIIPLLPIGILVARYQRLTCKHDYKKIKTVHGDQIIAMGWTRSIWVCEKCKHEYWSGDLNKMTKR